jgi:hypothetical protein
MNPRALASSHTGSRGHEVRHASITSAYGRWSGPIHESRSRIKLSTVSGTSSIDSGAARLRNTAITNLALPAAAAYAANSQREKISSWESGAPSFVYECAATGSGVTSPGACASTLIERISEPTTTAPKANTPAATQKATV